ncbi:hypothetical protein ACFV2C_13875, partial [[Kitasatospora] papulosa]
VVGGWWGWSRRSGSLWGVLFLAVAVSVARGGARPRAGLVLRGYHWPLDVVAGWCLSGVLLLALRAVTRSGQLPK